MHGKVFIDIVSTIVKVLHQLGEESHNLNKLNNNVETSYVPYRRNILIEVDVMYGQFDQNEQPFRTNYVQVFFILEHLLHIFQICAGLFQSICSIDCFSDGI